MLLLLAALFAATVVAAEPPPADVHARAAIVGTVTLTDARGETFGAPGAQVALACPGAADNEREATSDEHGVFRFAGVRPGRCTLTADLQGFGRVTTDVAVRAAETVQVEIHLDVEAVGTGVRLVAGSRVGTRLTTHASRSER
jgi:hypothetical protein